MAEIKLQTPLSDEDIEKLHIGDTIFLSGIIYTARDAAHKRLVDLIKEGKPLPIDIKGGVIYYVGPAPAKPGYAIGPAGPTTSYRMDSYTPILHEQGLKATIGKGNRGAEVVDALKKYKAAYLAATGGVAALIAKSIRKAEIVAYEDLGAEAIRRLEVCDFPCIVANDCYGGDLFQEGVKKYRIT
ncbi:MAG: fumarate hydratase [bacterium (Candidatus Stahlbacteria) CG08_land_8_20_14_0_20_40_26]|nr:MAG: fumarate hydratase [bacterium (Candidatus Stahlbacteria) CG23_combo_of_CG06-09_8_20_14_all_40_9]PIS24536.1 MAG: fumarate hydratase [bacterium (Candidatus Stahlbacteria) CG08_land_8_20_14_0_20_40_26]